MSTTDNQTRFVPYINLDAKKESDTPNLVQALDAARNALGLYPGQKLIFGGNLTGTRMHFWRAYRRGTPSLTIMTPTEGLNVFSKDQEIHNHFRTVKATALWNHHTSLPPWTLWAARWFSYLALWNLHRYMFNRWRYLFSFKEKSVASIGAAKGQLTGMVRKVYEV